MPPGAALRPHPLLERLRRRVLGPLFDRLGYDLVPAVPDWAHRPLSRRETEALFAAAAARLDADLAACGLSLPGGARPAIETFWDLIGAAPVAQRRGGNGFNGALCLYVLMRALRPPVVIESGVFRGLTTWITRQACPEAEILCFDPDLSGLRYRDRRARYHAGDWSERDLGGLDLAEGVGFFDDHISQARRVREARARGLTRLIFDDDAAAHRLHAHGGPAFPTIAMLCDEAAGPEPVRWRRNGRDFVYRPDGEEARAARAAIRLAHPFDDLHAATGYSPARITYVALAAPGSGEAR
ncbi:hypothetical protein M446_6475 [Methylobacterium sp. 4-46]|uniref:hypothetical protein n=1 Tax=unclassified Methylobacterium TaxID=2615210 RepID=UPI000165CD7A|nr:MULTISPECIES: hypothetical protein [Methylobacterium]ACA20734.1 hypothetical protein M446_6475 [Methylobacterium sp. 4-46]WFT79887.1 hypothetical protein QA634_32680 [Methylobacterium nodulans]